MLKFTVLLISFLFSLSLKADTAIIRVGAYDFPPFIEWKNGPEKGLLNEFLKLLNEEQNKYHFTIIETSPNRRYQDLYLGRYDVIFFESKEWEWDKSSVPVSFSDIFLTGGELFVAKNVPGRNQDYFKTLKDKKIRAYLGYHYTFLNFSTNPKDHIGWKVEFTNSHDGNIKAVIEERVDLAVVTREYLNVFLQKNPDIKDDIIISHRLDQVYQYMAITLPKGKISPGELNYLINKIKKGQKFKKLFQLQ